ncbi:MAG: SagB/ThcOx family dehydrogenase [Acidobacteriia bacterium]|nr:SagB/ThcOx family dehydrogenase [Terriglobia bacterium]
MAAGLAVTLACLLPAGNGGQVPRSKTLVESASEIALPAPARTGRISLEEALARRRSVREFSTTPLTAQELSQLLWAAQGITHPEGLRTAPSAGALYPLELYVATAAGFYHYDPQLHRLRKHAEGDLRPALYRAALEQPPVLQAPAVFLIAAVYERTAKKYGKERAVRYVHIEAGHAAENLLLQAVTLNLGAVPVGAFDDAQLQKAASLPAGQRPLYLIPAGHPR